MSTIAASVTNLKLKFSGEDAFLFKGVSLSFNRGEKVLLLGPSGCGKSTMLQVLSGLIPGSIEVPMKSDDLIIPQRWGYVFQDPDTQFCMPYVDEEMAFVLENMQVQRDRMPTLISHYLQQVGLNAEETHILIQTLSQGMKQRLAIASILAMEPDVLFLDEPTALLDQEGTEQVWATIRSVSDHKTLIVVEHKIDGIVDFFDRVILFSPYGEVIADGSPEDIFVNYKNELVEFGIWYPGIWDDYTGPHSLRMPIKPAASQPAKAVLQMDKFVGKRGKSEVIKVEKAAVCPGEWIGVMGANGAGKSSLLLSIMRLLKTEGECVVAGKQLAKVERAAEHIAFVFQNPEFQFVTNTVQDELEYSLLMEDMQPALRQHKVNDLLEWLQLREIACRHPYQLSMGQKRRLSVGAAIVRGQKLLLLDEPTFGLDARNTFSMLEKLEQLRCQGTSIIMVTHDARIVERFCTGAWNIEDGRLTDAIDLSLSRHLAAQR